MATTNESLIKQYESIHGSTKYGATSYKLLPRILPEVFELSPESILDYGCGQSRLIDLLDPSGKIATYRYDPSIKEISDIPIESVDMLLNTDVLEHIPEGDLDDVLQEMKILSDNVFFSICTVPAERILPSGENAHCTVRPASWWEKKLLVHFPYVELISKNRKRYLCKTWKSNGSAYLKKKCIFIREKVKYKLEKHLNKPK
jgi:hypothetical protein